MAQTGQAVYEAISERMDLRLEKLAIETILAAKDAASGAIAKKPCRDHRSGQRPLKSRRRGPQRGLALLRRVLGVVGVGRRWRGRSGDSGGVSDHGPGVMRASSANIHGSTAPRQAARFRNRRTAAASAPSGSSDRLKPGADLPAAPAYFMQIHRSP